MNRMNQTTSETLAEKELFVSAVAFLLVADVHAIEEDLIQTEPKSPAIHKKPAKHKASAHTECRG